MQYSNGRIYLSELFTILFFKMIDLFEYLNKCLIISFKG